MNISQFTVAEIEIVGKLINWLGVVGSQTLLRNSPDLSQKALTLLQHAKQQNEKLLRRLDDMARSSRDESVLRLIEDLEPAPNDILHKLQIVRRCMAASAFLGHCIAIHYPQNLPLVELPGPEAKVLH